MTLPSSGISRDVGARAERAARSGDDEKPDVVVVLGFVVRGAELGDHVRAERVEGVRPIQRDRGRVSGDLVADVVVRLIRHVGVSLRSAAWSDCHRPWKFGGRRSRKAARPSLKSAVRQESSRLNSSCFMAWSNAECWPELMACLASPSATVGPAASRASSSSAAASRSSGATASWIRPQSAASAPAHLFAEQQHPASPGHSDEPGQQPRRPRVGGEAAVQERLPEHGIRGRDREVGGQRQIAAEPHRPASHAAHHRQTDGVQQFDDAVGRKGHAADEVAGAGPLAAGVGAHPVRARAEVVTCTANVNRTKGVIGGSLASAHRRTGRSCDDSVRFGARDGRATI